MMTNKFYFCPAPRLHCEMSNVTLMIVHWSNPNPPIKPDSSDGRVVHQRHCVKSKAENQPKHFAGTQRFIMSIYLV
jgi:hypothetical protein